MEYKVKHTAVLAKKRDMIIKNKNRKLVY